MKRKKRQQKRPSGFLLDWEAREWEMHDAGHWYMRTRFPGGAQIVVWRLDERYNLQRWWHVWWSVDNPSTRQPDEPLRFKKFRTCLAAQRAAEEFFVPMLRWAPFLVKVRTETTMETGLR